SLEGLAPVAAGRFTIHGSHDRARVKPNSIGIEIEAALAFGTGHHGTTRGCLLALDDLLKRRRPRHPLDIGTGTGVLAIAAALAAYRAQGLHLVKRCGHDEWTTLVLKRGGAKPARRRRQRPRTILPTDARAHPRACPACRFRSCSRQSGSRRRPA